MVLGAGGLWEDGDGVGVGSEAQGWRCMYVYGSCYWLQRAVAFVAHTSGAQAMPRLKPTSTTQPHPATPNSTSPHSALPQELVEGPWAQSNLDAGSSLLVPVRGSAAGAVVVGESSVMFVEAGGSARSAAISPTLVKVRTGRQL